MDKIRSAPSMAVGPTPRPAVEGVHRSGEIGEERTMTVWSTFIMSDPRAQGWARKTHVHRGDVIVVYELGDTAFRVQRNLGMSDLREKVEWRFEDDTGKLWRLSGSYLIYWPQPYCEIHKSWRPCEHNGGAYTRTFGWHWPLPLPGTRRGRA